MKGPHIIVSAVHWYKNQKANVEKTFAFSGSFVKRSVSHGSLYAEILRGISHRLAGVIIAIVKCTSLHGVDIF